MVRSNPESSHDLPPDAAPPGAVHFPVDSVFYEEMGVRPELLQILRRARNSPQPDLALIGQAALLPAATGAERTEKNARAWINADPLRGEQRKHAKALLPLFNPYIQRCQSMLDSSLVRERNSHEEKFSPVAGAALIRVHNIPLLVKLLVGSALVVSGLCFEITNSVNLVEEAEVLPDADYFGRFAFAAPYILASLAAFLLPDIVLESKGRRRFYKILLLFVVIAATFGAYIFTWLLGEYIDPDPMSASMGPPFNLVIFGALLASGAALGVGKGIVKSAGESLFAGQIMHTPAFQFHKQNADKAQKALSEACYVKNWLTELLAELSDEEERFVQQCLAHLEAAQDYLIKEQLQRTIEISGVPAAIEQLRVSQRETEASSAAIRDRGHRFDGLSRSPIDHVSNNGKE